MNSARKRCAYRYFSAFREILRKMCAREINLNNRPANIFGLKLTANTLGHPVNTYKKPASECWTFSQSEMYIVTSSGRSRFLSNAEACSNKSQNPGTSLLRSTRLPGTRDLSFPVALRILSAMAPSRKSRDRLSPRQDHRDKSLPLVRRTPCCVA